MFRDEKTKKRFYRRLSKERKNCGHYSTGSGSLGFRLKRLGFSNYGSYLSSDHWKKLREKYIELYGLSCVAQCGRDGQHLHHKTYERLGNESLEDFAFLCADCHGSVHWRERSAIKGGIETALRRVTTKNRKLIGLKSGERQHKKNCTCAKCFQKKIKNISSRA